MQKVYTKRDRIRRPSRPRTKKVMANRANNAGAGAGGGGGQNANEHVEFTVKAEEDLYLEGQENTIRRVVADTNYSCLMLKTQRFSSLFRHYAKYHGLRKDDLEYYFVNPLENEDTPESVQLQRGDTIMVRKKRKSDPPKAAADDKEFFKDMQDLMDDEEHMDAVFVIDPYGLDGPSSSSSVDGDSSAQPIEIRAHKCVLTARGEYFRGLFRKETFTATNSGRVNVGKEFSEKSICAMLEFVYCNRIYSIPNFTVEEILELMNLSDRWILKDLKRLCEFELTTRMDLDNVARMYCASEACAAPSLSKYCIEFIMDNLREVTSNASFKKEMEHYPELLFPVLNRVADSIAEPAHKKQRTTEPGSPVPSEG